LHLSTQYYLLYANIPSFRNISRICGSNSVDLRTLNILMNYRIKILFVAIGLVVFACVEPYDLNFGSQKEILFIEADLNDYDSLQYVSIKKNIPEPNNIVYRDIETATVELIENKTTSIPCTYSKQGRYQLPRGFRIKVGVPYQLKLRVEGYSYESTLETANKVTSINNIYSRFKEKGINYRSKDLDGHEIYIDSDDSQLKGENYLWQWRLFEKQNYCATCDGGRYFTSPAPLGRCVDDANLKRRGVIYDYQCSSECWEVFYNEDVNVMSDIYSNGQTIKGRLIAKVPFFQFRSSIIEIQQYSISKSAFAYLSLLVNQTQRNGTLADTPPAGLVGNISNIENKTEAVGGIFMVSSKTTKSFVIDRKENSPNISAFGLFNGRAVSPEPSGNDTTRPPAAPCVESNNRTKIKPLGWID
jgi:hypothetical protein